MKTYKELIDDIQNFLRNFSVDFKKEVSWNAMEFIGNEMQSIEHNLKEVEDYNKHIDSVASELEEQKEDLLLEPETSKLYELEEQKYNNAKSDKDL